MKYTQPPGTPDDSPYVDFNPVTGVEGSVVPAAAIEAVQREIVNVITQAGLTPSGTDLTQLYEAIQAIFDNLYGQGSGYVYSGKGERGNDLPENSTFTTPAYVVGKLSLTVVWNGLYCVPNVHYEEVGVVGETSTTIKLLFKLKTTATLFVKNG